MSADLLATPEWRPAGLPLIVLGVALTLSCVLRGVVGLRKAIGLHQRHKDPSRGSDSWLGQSTHIHCWRMLPL